jgi:hypothetical protein
LTVDLMPGKQFDHPLAEDEKFLISIAGALDQALHQATSGPVLRLQRDYKWGPSETVLIMGLCHPVRRSRLGGHAGEYRGQTAQHWPAKLRRPL